MLDKLIEGLIVSAIGIGVTFLLMYVLVLCINLFKFFVGGKGKAPKTDNGLPQIFSYNQKQTTNQTDSKEYAQSEINKKTVAAITAAVACYLQSEGKTEGDFIVRKIRKIF